MPSCRCDECGWFSALHFVAWRITYMWSHVHSIHALSVGVCYNSGVGLRCLLGPNPGRGRSGNRSRPGYFCAPNPLLAMLLLSSRDRRIVVSIACAVSTAHHLPICLSAKPSKECVAEQRMLPAAMLWGDGPHRRRPVHVTRTQGRYLATAHGKGKRQRGAGHERLLGKVSDHGRSGDRS